jgi:hypothetical protein
MQKTNSVVAVYSTHSQAEEAVRAFQGSGFDMIVGALGEGALVGGLTALGAGLYSIGIPRDSILRYETALKADQFVVVAHGTVDDVTTAKRILEGTGALSVDDHRAPVA